MPFNPFKNKWVWPWPSDTIRIVQTTDYIDIVYPGRTAWASKYAKNKPAHSWSPSPFKNWWVWPWPSDTIRIVQQTTVLSFHPKPVQTYNTQHYWTYRANCTIKDTLSTGCTIYVQHITMMPNAAVLTCAQSLQFRHKRQVYLIFLVAQILIQNHHLPVHLSSSI